MLAFYWMYWSHGWRPSMGVAGMVAMGAGTAGALLYAKATTMTHAAVVTTQIGNGFAQRTNRESIFKVGLLSNRFLMWGILVELVAINVLIYVQPFQRIFEHGPLQPIDWVVLAALVPTLLVADEIRKVFVRRRQPLTAEAAAEGNVYHMGQPAEDAAEAAAD
jgi:magnesium-transporting ATPase (P-type)